MLPYEIKEIIALILAESGRLFLFMLKDRDNQCNDLNDQSAKHEKFFPCDHAYHLPPARKAHHIRNGFLGIEKATATVWFISFRRESITPEGLRQQ